MHGTAPALQDRNTGRLGQAIPEANAGVMVGSGARLARGWSTHSSSIGGRRGAAVAAFPLGGDRCCALLTAIYTASCPMNEAFAPYPRAVTGGGAVPRRISRRTTSIGIGAGLTLVAYLLGLRARCLRWGATDEEVAGRLPGDDLVPQPMYQTTRAIAIQAAPATVWAWLIQLGQGRGGFYTFDRLENLAGLNIHSVDRIVPELQRLAVGDIVPLSPAGGPTVARIEPSRTMVLHFVMDLYTGGPVDHASPGAHPWMDWTWTFALRAVEGMGTRLVVRTRATYAPRLLLAPLSAVLLEPVHGLMEWGMLRGIKRRAESTATTQPEAGSVTTA